MSNGTLRYLSSIEVNIATPTLHMTDIFKL